MEKLIRYGIIGIGGMGANHANLLLQNKINNACLASVCDMNKSFANNFADIPFYSNVSDFFNKEKIDVAIIATPHRKKKSGNDLGTKRSGDSSKYINYM